MPTAARPWLAAIALACAAPAFASDPSSLDEAEIVRRALSRPALADAIDAEVDLARAEELEVRRWPNPEAAWAREEVRVGGATGREDVATLTQRLDLSGRRGLRGDAAARRVDAARAEAELRRLEVEAEARRVFADALAQERRVAVLRAAAQRLDAVVAAVARRAASGDVAGYDRRRVDRERLATLARLDAEEGALARIHARLAALTGADPEAPLALRGDLESPSPPPLASLLDRLPSRPDLAALELEARSGELEARAGARWFIPEVELGGGLKTVEAGGDRANGFAAGIAIPIPLFARDQGERLRGDARARAARSRLALALASARADVTGLHAEATRLAAAAARYRARAGDDGAALLGAAEAAYRGGEVGVLELVDGYRAALDADLAIVELEWAARRARIDLDRTSGGASR